MSVQFYLRIPPCAPADQIAAFVRECEDAGFAGVGILDSPLLLRELFVTMTAAALATSRIRLATAVTQPGDAPRLGPGLCRQSGGGAGPRSSRDMDRPAYDCDGHHWSAARSAARCP